MSLFFWDPIRLAKQWGFVWFFSPESLSAETSFHSPVSQRELHTGAQKLSYWTDLIDVIQQDIPALWDNNSSSVDWDGEINMEQE